MMISPELIRPDPSAFLIIGRSTSADIPLYHPGVSRKHASLGINKDCMVISDLGSRFGTKVNGTRIVSQTVTEGDRIEFGPVAYVVHGFRLELLDQSAGISLEANNLCISRGGKELLHSVNLSIQPNQFVGILGLSGSGKTTLLKCLASFVPSSNGSLTFDEIGLADNLETYRVGLGYVPQDDVVFGALNAWENLDYALQLRGSADLRVGERREIIRETLKRVNLSDHANKPVMLLSGGQRKRVNIATELLSRPRILFLDEPTSGLDPATETRIMRLMKELTNKGTTVVCSTHVMANLELFDQVLVVANRMVVYKGTPHALLNQFSLKAFPELYERLEQDGHNLKSLSNTIRPEQAESFSASGMGVLKGIQLIKTQTTPKPAKIPAPGMVSQVSVQLRRGFRVLVRDRFLVAALVIQPILIGLLISLSQVRPNGLDALFLFAVVTSIWLGLNNTARDVVADRPVYIREHMAGVTPEGYLGAKILVHGIMGAVQVLLLILMLRYFNYFLPKSDANDLAKWSVVHMFLVLWITYLAGMTLGLLVSTLSNSQETAVASLPMILLPQLLLSGVATGLNDSRDGFFRSLVILVQTAAQSSRQVAGWFLELVSLLTYSRPALCLFQQVRGDQVTVNPALIALVDWVHLILLLLLTATGLLAVFHWRQRSWLLKS